MRLVLTGRELLCGQLADGRVKNVSAATAGELLADGFVLLDVRPPEEVAKVSSGLSVSPPEDIAKVSAGFGF